MTRPAVARAAAGIGAVTAASRALGFVRVLVIAAVLGTTYLGNTFQASNSVSNVLFELVAAGALSAVLVPTFVAHLARDERDQVEHLAGGLLGLATVVLGVIAVLGVVFAPLLARALTAGASSAVAAQQRELATFLLRFFVPQLVLYGWGAIATGLLYAERKFIPTAAAPIGNTIVTVGALGVFATMVAAPRGLHLSLGARMMLVLAGTGGVIAFVGVLVYSARAAGYRLRPHVEIGDPEVRRLVKHSGWGVALHAAGGLLLGGALIVGNSVAGGVVAYQTAFTFFLAPYAILAQPIQTAVLPEISVHAAERDIGTFATTLEWALTRIAVIVLPVAAVLAALAYPLMQLVVFGEAARNGVGLFAAGIASLAAGLYCYSAFLTVARGYYAMGDSRTPALVALACGVLGVVVMSVGAALTHGTARVAALGLGHTACYTVGLVLLGTRLGRRVQHRMWSGDATRALVAAGAAGLAAWGVAVVLGASSRAGAFVALVAGLVAAGAVYIGAARLLRLTLFSRAAA